MNKRTFVTRAKSMALLLATTLIGCNGPFVMIPGGALDGAVLDAPSSWKFSDDVTTVQLETRPTDPYSVNIWIATIDPNLYLHAGANRSTWVEHIESDPRVRVRISDGIYELIATRVSEQAEFDQFSGAYEDKYSTAPRNPNVNEAYLFRLQAPSPSAQ